MKTKDLYVALVLIALFAPFALSDSVLDHYNQLNSEHGFILSFLKFAILATLGESIGLRISAGCYNRPGFGLLPRAIVWGFLGIAMKMAIVIFAIGVPGLLTYAGMEQVKETLSGGLSFAHIFIAFAISVFANLFFAPIMMVFHKVTDTHIMNTGGTVKGLLSRIEPGAILSDMNWQFQWDFVLKKTIPFFWIPAHTITFLLPADHRVLFAALLGVALGVILSIAAVRGRAKAGMA